jgi:hypothetical protein
MSALRLNFRLETLKAVFPEHGVYLLETMLDGQTRWGDRPMQQPYQGRSAMGNPYVNFGDGDRYDIFTIRAIIQRLGKTVAQQVAIESALMAFEQIVGDEDPPQASSASVN